MNVSQAKARAADFAVAAVRQFMVNLRADRGSLTPLWEGNRWADHEAAHIKALDMPSGPYNWDADPRWAHWNARERKLHTDWRCLPNENFATGEARAMAADCSSWQVCQCPPRTPFTPSGRRERRKPRMLHLQSIPIILEVQHTRFFVACKPRSR